MRKTILVALVACCLSLFLGASIANAGPRGECNRIIAQNLGLVNQLAGGVASPVECVDLLGSLIEFVTSPNQCPVLLANGELFVKDNNLAETFCSVVIDTCGVPPILLPPGTCAL